MDWSASSLFHAENNFEAFRQTGETADSHGANDQKVCNRIRMTVFGDTNCNGYIDNGETPVALPFVLVAAGEDGVFGPVNYTPSTTDALANQKALSKCDDVTNVP